MKNNNLYHLRCAIDHKEAPSYWVVDSHFGNFSSLVIRTVATGTKEEMDSLHALLGGRAPDYWGDNDE